MRELSPAGAPRSRPELTTLEQCLVDLQVIFCHSPGGKTALERLPDAMAIQTFNPAQSCHSLGLTVDHKPGRAVLHNLGDRTATKCDHWGAACHCFDLH